MLQSDGCSYAVNSSVPNSYSFLYFIPVPFTLPLLTLCLFSDCCSFVGICLLSWLLLCCVVLVCITLHVVPVITSAIGPLPRRCVWMKIMLYSMVKNCGMWTTTGMPAIVYWYVTFSMVKNKNFKNFCSVVCQWESLWTVLYNKCCFDSSEISLHHHGHHCCCCCYCYYYCYLYLFICGLWFSDISKYSPLTLYTHSIF